MSFIHSKIWKKTESGIQSILSLKPIAHLNKLKEIKIDEISDEWVFQILQNNKFVQLTILSRDSFRL
jgi:hypothetical protein